MNASIPPSGSRSPYRWVVLSTFILIHSAALIGAVVLGILLPSITEDLGLSPSEQGWLGSSAFIGNLALSLPFGWWLSRYSAKWTVTVSLTLGALCLFIQGWAPFFILLLLGRLFFGLTALARDPPKALLFRQWLDQREIPLVNGLLNAAFGVMLTIGFVVTPLVLNIFDGDWRKPFYSYAALNVVFALVWAMVGRENITGDYKRSVTSQEGTLLRSLLRYREPWLVGIGMVGYSMAQMAQFTFWPTFMRDEFGMSLVTSGWLIGVLGLIVATGGFIVVPLLSRRAGNRAPLLIIGVTLCTTFLGTLETDSIPILVGVLIINGLGRGAFWTIFNTIPFELPGSRPREVALAQALMQTMFWGGGVLGPILVGFIHQATGDLKLAMVVIFICPIAMTLASLIPSGQVKPRSVET